MIATTGLHNDIARRSRSGKRASRLGAPGHINWPMATSIPRSGRNNTGASKGMHNTTPLRYTIRTNQFQPRDLKAPLVPKNNL